MKSLIRFRMGSLLAALAIGSLIALPAFAEANGKINPEHSTAWIFLGSNSSFQNVGVARVSGVARLNSAEPEKSALDIHADLPDGQWLSFKSERFEVRADGRLEVSGAMTLAGLRRDMSITPGEDYRGAIYGERTMHALTREVSFILPLADAAGPNGEITAEAQLGIENFPQLFAVVRDAGWQPIAQDEACQIQQVGEDYRGAICSGRMIAPAPRLEAVSAGEDYRGFRPAMPAGNSMKLVLQLKLV